ncbi:MAG: hypothetical protein IJ307_06330 [Bacteroidales bacterium]|nr:hypothetical protein [Bacteroidales bacterium]MBQ8969646.1 hypothetical protein [Bacteroidaceae bacterium]
MQEIPTLVQDLGVARLTNSVYVGTVKFTVDEVKKWMDTNFTTERPAPEKLKNQLYDARMAFQVVNQAYAVTLRSAITDEIAALDKEGDQLIYAVKGTVDAALRMTFDAEKVQRAQYYSEFLKKYKIDPTENMISEWSKVQQACEEATTNYQLELAEKALGITAAMDRLKVIADTIRQKITNRAAELPAAQQMKNARAQMDPEYRALILILNSFAVTADDNYAYTEIIKTLNDNINYVRIHAMSKAAAAEEETPAEGGDSAEGEKADGNSEGAGE